MFTLQPDGTVVHVETDHGNHLCSFTNSSNSCLPHTTNKDTTLGKAHRKFLKSILIAELPKAYFYYRSKSGIIRERRAQVEAGYLRTIHPFSNFRRCWEIVMVIIYFIELLLIPLNPKFYYHNNDSEERMAREFGLIYYVGAYTLLNIFNFIDFIMNFVTGIARDKTKEVTLKPSIIVCHYILSVHLYCDLLASIPFPLIDYLVNDYTGFVYLEHIFELITLTRIVRLPTLRIYMSRFNGHFNFDDNLVRLRQYILVSVMIFHWIACINVIVPEYFFLEGWGTNIFRITTRSHLDMYVNSLYQSMSFLLGVAQVNGLDGTVYTRASGFAEVVLLMITMIAGYIVCNLMFVLIVQIILSMKTSQTKYQAILNQLSNYMSHKQLPIIMQKRLTMYYEYRFEKTYFRENSIYSVLSDTIHTEINIHTCRSFIDNVSLLKDLPHNMIGEVLSYLSHEVFLPNDIIVKAGSGGDCMYFISRGTVTVSTPNGREVCHLQDGTYFGEISLVTREQKRIANVVAIEICELYRLDRKGFIACFASNPHLYKTIELTAQRRMKKCNLLEELHKKFLIERTLRRNIDTEEGNSSITVRSARSVRSARL